MCNIKICLIVQELFAHGRNGWRVLVSVASAVLCSRCLSLVMQSCNLRVWYMVCVCVCPKMSVVNVYGILKRMRYAGSHVCVRDSQSFIVQCQRGQLPLLWHSNYSQPSIGGAFHNPHADVILNEVLVLDFCEPSEASHLTVHVLLVLENIRLSGQHCLRWSVLRANVDDSQCATGLQNAMGFPKNLLPAILRSFVKGVHDGNQIEGLARKVGLFGIAGNELCFPRRESQFFL
mmetsp:Transcript_15874/g.43913  ORF Transcript_15874/g.43913 Transcript_15874/m.43913 type:complete len:233 (-) Transcript_15874:2212-2910(-)